jgi:hypothetical protein
VRVGLPQPFEPGAIGEAVEGDDAVAQDQLAIAWQRDRSGCIGGRADERLDRVDVQRLRMPQVVG